MNGSISRKGFQGRCSGSIFSAAKVLKVLEADNVNVEDSSSDVESIEVEEEQCTKVKLHTVNNKSSVLKY